MEGEDPATYQWLTELARYKPSNFSCLKRVEVTEEGGKGTWIASKTVKALFDSAGVALDVRLRGRKSKPRRVKDSRAGKWTPRSDLLFSFGKLLSSNETRPTI